MLITATLVCLCVYVNMYTKIVLMKVYIGCVNQHDVSVCVHVCKGGYVQMLCSYANVVLMKIYTCTRVHEPELCV